MKFKSVYLIGIGGIGMSALARYYKHNGYFVAGYDRTQSALTKELEKEGMLIHYVDDAELIPEQCRDMNETLVIYTPAIPASNKVLQFFTNSNFNILKRSKILGLIAKDKRTLAVAGTHGKTTTSTLLARLLSVATEGCTAFLGGISKNYASNLLLSDSDVLVAEADEFDRSFLQLYPYAAVITSIDADHLDIYGTADEIKKAFNEFVAQINPGGTLIIKKGVDINIPNNSLKVYRYSYNEECDFYASNIKLNKDACYSFDINTPEGKICDCKLGIPGWINVENAIAATALAWTIGFDEAKLKLALESFSGVKRRFDIQINKGGITYIDDYAHHPEELKATISSIKKMFEGRKLTAIFQPHLYTRTRDFANDFAKSLSMADEVILLDIYPARELPIEGVSSEIIFENIISTEKTLCTGDELLDVLKHKDIDVLVTFGAGNIDLCVEPITKMLVDKYSL